LSFRAYLPPAGAARNLLFVNNLQRAKRFTQVIACSNPEITEALVQMAPQEN
jgi:hypothetical protein